MRRLSLIALLTFVVAIPAFAEDDPAAESTPFADAAKAWPAPSKDSAFREELVAVFGGNPLGTYVVECGPDEVDGKVVGWRLHERLAIKFGDKNAAGDVVQRVGLDLTPVEGKSADNFSKPEKDEWSTKDGTITLTHVPGGGEARTSQVAAKPYMSPGKLGVFMAARFMPAKAATYTGTDFSGNDEDEPAVAFTLTVDPEARHEGRKVLGFHGVRGKKHVELLVEPDDRSVLKGRLWEEDSHQRLTLLPASAAPKMDDLFAREPRNAQEGSAHALYAITMKDRSLIEKAFRWSTMYEVTKQKLEAAQQPVPTFEEFKEAALAQFTAGERNASVTPGQLKAGLQMYVSKAGVQDTPQGWKAVVWPKEFALVLIVMEKKDDGWKAIGVRKLGG